MPEDHEEDMSSEEALHFMVHEVLHRMAEVNAPHYAMYFYTYELVHDILDTSDAVTEATLEWERLIMCSVHAHLALVNQREDKTTYENLRRELATDKSDEPHRDAFKFSNGRTSRRLTMARDAMFEGLDPCPDGATNRDHYIALAELGECPWCGTTEENM